MDFPAVSIKAWFLEVLGRLEAHRFPSIEMYQALHTLFISYNNFMKLSPIYVEIICEEPSRNHVFFLQILIFKSPVTIPG